MDSFLDSSLVDLFRKGGLCMWPIAACSILAVAISLERVLFFARIRIDGRAFLDEVKGRLARGARAGALGLCQTSRHPLASVVRTYVELLDADPALRDDVVRREGSREIERVERRVPWLGVIAHLSPLLGLLGTVTGLVGAFRVIESERGAAEPGQLAGGIWEALLTTVFGLAVAIPTLAAYHGFTLHSDRISRHLEFAVSELNELTSASGRQLSTEGNSPVRRDEEAASGIPAPAAR
jgi:biopolymer transport protein ExbB